jgi:hypothetical protein
VRLILTPTAESVAAFNEVFDNFAKLPQRFAAKAFEPAFEVYSGAVTWIFASEGPGWAPLKPTTVEERFKLDYGPTRPILMREGELFRSLTEMNNPQHTIYVRSAWGPDEPHISGSTLDESAMSGADQWFAFGTLDDRFEELNEKRPMVPGDDAGQAIGRLIEQRLVALIQGMDNPHASI